MTDEVRTDDNITKIFKFSFPTCTNETVLFKLEVPVGIPHNGSTQELVQRVLSMFHIPVYLEDELNEKLSKFVADETKTFHNERDRVLVDQLRNSELNSEGIIKHWEKLFKDNVMEYAEQKGTSDEEVFAAAYHKLVHSPALETILQVENSYAATFSELRSNRDRDIQQLTQKQTEEMEDMFSNLYITSSAEEINDLAGEQIEEQVLVAGRWGSQLDALWQTQRAQYRAWLMGLLQEYQSTSALNTPSNSPLGTFSARAAEGAPPAPAPSPPPPPAPRAPRLEESFTIHLGSQLKQTHNIRIVAADILDLCALGNPDSGTETSRRLQTSLSLYSGEVSGCVLVTEGGPGGLAGGALAAAAAATTDHHFPHVDSQLRHLATHLAHPVEERNKQRMKEQCDGGAGGARRVRDPRSLQPGDVFVTRHSNLAEVHTVLHLLVDHRTLKQGDITSRHPAILGLRNILKAACANDITNLTLPLLLRHELTEEMTVSWCVRRAELVLKCVKGFMLEMSGWGGAELRTLTLCVPPGVAGGVFAALAALLPAVFRVSNPVRGTTHAHTHTHTHSH